MLAGRFSCAVGTILEASNCINKLPGKIEVAALSKPVLTAFSAPSKTSPLGLTKPSDANFPVIFRIASPINSPADFAS